MTAQRDVDKPNRGTTGRWGWVAIVIVLSLAAFAYWGRDRDPADGNPVRDSAPQENDHSRIRERLEREISGILNQTDQRNRQAYEKARAELAETNKGFDEAVAGIGPAVNELASFKGCALLCYLMAKDGLAGGCEAEERIGSILKEHLTPRILAATQQTESVLARLDDALAQNATDMQIRLAGMARTVLAQEDQATRAAFTDLVARLTDVSSRFNSIATQTLASAVGLGISAVLVKSTYRQAIRVLGAIAGRMGTTTALAIVSAAADGPFPFLDAIALVLEVGGATWCAYDLYHAQGTLKDQAGQELTTALAQYRVEVMDLGRKKSMDLLKAYHDQNTRLAKDLKNKLS